MYAMSLQTTAVVKVCLLTSDRRHTEILNHVSHHETWKVSVCTSPGVTHASHRVSLCIDINVGQLIIQAVVVVLSR